MQLRLRRHDRLHHGQVVRHRKERASFSEAALNSPVELHPRRMRGGHGNARGLTAPCLASGEGRLRRGLPGPLGHGQVHACEAVGALPWGGLPHRGSPGVVQNRRPMARIRHALGRQGCGVPPGLRPGAGVGVARASEGEPHFPNELRSGHDRNAQAGHDARVGRRGHGRSGGAHGRAGTGSPDVPPELPAGRSGSATDI